MAKKLRSNAKLNLANQEIERIIDEIEQILSLIQETGAEGVLVDAVATTLTADLGYADKNELEDALKSSFEDFLNCLPDIEITRDSEDRKLMRIKPLQLNPEGGYVKPLRASQLAFQVQSREDLKTICVKAPGAVIRIPELEFDFGPQQIKQTDTLYNFIGIAITQLSTHTSTSDLMDSETKAKIDAAVNELEKLLDVEIPWTWLVFDKTGMSEIHAPIERVGVIYFDDMSSENKSATNADSS